MLNAMRSGNEGGDDQITTLQDIGKGGQSQAQRDEEEEMMAEDDEEQRKKKEGEDLSQFFLNAEGKPFDPLKKFGSIEDGN